MRAVTRGWTVVLVALASACSSYGSTPAATINLTNTWTGTNSNSRGSGNVTEHLTQSGYTVTGTISGTSVRTNGTVTYSGTLTGTLNGSTLTYSVTVPVGGFSAPDTACSLVTSASATVTNTTFHGTYTGTVTCNGVQTPVTDGAVNLTAP